MPESAEAVAKRAVELFNHEFGAGPTGISDETRALWAPEPLIVPFRAALERNAYGGPTALDDFAAETRESWRWVRIENAEIRELDPRRALIVGDLRGCGRETGAETSAPVALLLIVNQGRITESRTFMSEREALEAATA
jgi:ketosteroid isomerase-like protein